MGKETCTKPEWNEPEMDHDRVKEMEEGLPVDESGMKGSDLIYAMIRSNPILISLTTM